MPLATPTGLRNDYGLVADRVRDATLLRRRPGYYVAIDGPYHCRLRRGLGGAIRGG